MLRFKSICAHCPLKKECKHYEIMVIRSSFGAFEKEIRASTFFPHTHCAAVLKLALPSLLLVAVIFTAIALF